MMSSSQILPLLCCLYFFSALSASALISDDVFGHHERRLLQAQAQAQAPKKPCPFNFEYLNYTIIKTECKGPDYPQKPCCDSFKNFACPYVDYINDSTTKCADDIINALETNGKFPPDLFFRRCRDGKDGIICPATPPSPALDQNVAVPLPPILMIQLFTLLACCFFFSRL